MNSFYITLLSDSSLSMYPKNTQCCFRNKLPKPIHIDKEEWEVALVEMIVPSQVNNVTEEEGKFQVVTTDQNLYGDMIEVLKRKRKCKTEDPLDVLGHELCISPGVYASPEYLVNEINDAIQIVMGEFLKKKNTLLQLQYSTHSKRVKMKQPGGKFGILFHPRMHMKLGGNLDLEVLYQKNHNPALDLDATKPFKDPFPYCVDLNVGSNHLFVYSDVAEYTLLGHMEAPILRVVPFHQRKQSNHLHEEFLNLHYIPVSKGIFDEIHINISGDTGQPIQFVRGKSMVKLHFRRKPRLNL